LVGALAGKHGSLIYILILDEANKIFTLELGGLIAVVDTRRF
jgi:hypothetical protein